MAANHDMVDAALPIGAVADLNGDGVSDYILKGTAEACGTGGCLYRIINGKSAMVIGHVWGNPLVVRAQMTSGFPDIDVYSHSSASTGSFTSYAFNGSKYVQRSKRNLAGQEVTALFAALDKIQRWPLAPALPTPIVFDQVQRITDGPPWGSSFGNVEIPCRSESGPRPVTLSEVLGPRVRALSVRRYNTLRLKTDDEVRDYIRTILTARPAGIWPTINWSEGVLFDVVIVTEWEDGRFGRIDLGGPYAHLQDHRGCEWWARLPPAR
jgi:hypothetical protein